MNEQNGGDKKLPQPPKSKIPKDDFTLVHRVGIYGVIYIKSMRLYACYKKSKNGLQKLSYLYNKKEDAIRYIETLNSKDIELNLN